MSDKKPIGKRRGAEPRKLPSSQRGLAYLLRAVDRCVEAAARHQHRQQLRYQELKKALDDPQRLVESRPLLDKMAAVALDQLASGPPPFDVVEPYVDQERVKPLLGQYKDAADRLRARPHPAFPSLDVWRPWIVALADLLEAQDKITALFRDLRTRLLAALDQAGPDRADDKTDETDNETDIKKKKRKRRTKLPDNLKLHKLARMINDPRNEERTKKDMALEVTGGNDLKAESLLRRWRDWRESLKRL